MASRVASYQAEPRLWVLLGYDNPSNDAAYRDEFVTAAGMTVAAAGGVVIAEAGYPGVDPLPDLGCVQVRRDSPQVLFQEARLQNLALNAVPPSVEYVAWVAGGARFGDRGWLRRAVERLAAGSSVVRLTAANHSASESCRTCDEFAWAMPRATADEVGLYDRSLTGDDRRLTAHALAGQPAAGCVTARLGHGTPAHRDYEAWAAQLPTRHVAAIDSRPIPGRSRARDVRAFDAQLAVARLRFDPAVDLELTPDELWCVAEGRDDLADWVRRYRLAPPPTPYPDRSAELLTAETLIHTGRYDEAAGILDAVFASGFAPSRCHRLRGLSAARQDCWTEAAEHFEEALSCLDADIEAHVDLAEAMDHLDCDEWLPAAELKCFAADLAGALRPDMVERLEMAADERFDVGRYREAAELYGCLVAARPADRVSRLGLAQCQLRSGAPRPALATLDGAHAEPSPDEITLRVRIYLAINLLDSAVALARRLLTHDSADVEALRAVLDVFSRSHADLDEDRFEGLVEQLPPDEQFELRLRLALLRRDDEAVRRLYRAASTDVSGAGDPVLAAEIHARTVDRDFAGISQILAASERSRSVHPDLLIAMIDAALAEPDWDRAFALLAHAEAVLPTTPEGPDPRLLHRQLLVDCQRLDFEAAEARIDSWPDIPDHCVAVVSGLYAAVGRWDDVLSLLRDRVDRGTNIEARLLQEAVSKAARATGRYADVIDQIDRASEIWSRDELVAFRDRIVAEMVLAADVGRPVDPIERDLQWPLYVERADVLSRALRSDVPRADGQTVYFCTDATYLPGTLVAVASLLRNNPGIARRTTIEVVVADAALPIAGPVFTQLSDGYDAPVTLTPAAALMTGEHAFRTTWGSFTPGHGLSDAAYYRIFKATQLVAAGATGRALYLDSDVIVGGGVERLLQTDLSGNPLAVRRELPLPEIVVAARKLNVPEELYFNSGVLLFDLGHPRLADALARSLDFAIHKPELLSFVDQCALNVGFLGHTAELQPLDNFYLRQDDQWTSEWSPTVLHFLARPKPWDPTYRTAHANRWVQEFELVGQVVRPSDLRAVMAAAVFPAYGA